MHNFDEVIVEKIRKNDEGVLREVYQAHYQMVLHMILLNSGTEQEAKDVYQEAVIVLYERIKTKSFQLTCLIKTYIYAVSRRLWLKRLAEKKLFTIKIDQSQDFKAIEEEWDEIDKREREYQAMDKSLGMLGEPCKTILEDFYLRAQSMEDIRDKFGYTNVDNAKNQKYKCLQRLKRTFFATGNTKKHE